MRKERVTGSSSLEFQIEFFSSPGLNAQVPCLLFAYMIIQKGVLELLANLPFMFMLPSENSCCVVIDARIFQFLP